MSASVAVLVDGDNISGKYAEGILSIAVQYGVLQVVRVYCDVRRNGEWHDAAGYRMQHAGAGKNGADLLLALDALELSLAGGIECFVISTSDGDFSHVATRLREKGGKVIGIGEAKAPVGFRECCSDFVEIGAGAGRVVLGASSFASALDKKIRTVIAEHSKNGGGMGLCDLGIQMHRRHGVRISTYPEGSWRGYFLARPKLYDVDPRGADAMVRYLPEGFRHVA